MKNLWKDLETLESDMTNPIDLVEAQSKYLEEGTDDMLFIEIDDVYKISTVTKNVIANVDLKNDFMYKASLCSAGLSDYSFTIFTVFYGITFYPLLLSVPNEIADEFVATSAIEVVDSTSKNRTYFLAKTEEEYEQLLENVLNSERVRTVLKNMKAIIEDVEQDE